MTEVERLAARMHFEVAGKLPCTTCGTPCAWGYRYGTTREVFGTCPNCGTQGLAMGLTPTERAARHMRVEALGGVVLQIPSFDEAMAMIRKAEHRCRVGLLRDKPAAVQWFLGALQDAQDWVDAQPLCRATMMIAHGSLYVSVAAWRTATRFAVIPVNPHPLAERTYSGSAPPMVQVIQLHPVKSLWHTYLPPYICMQLDPRGFWSCGGPRPVR